MNRNLFYDNLRSYNANSLNNITINPHTSNRFEFYDSLQHAESSLKGEQRENVKYYKREGEPGSYRYYYTKEEYDKAKASGETNDPTKNSKNPFAQQQQKQNNKVINKTNKQNNAVKNQAPKYDKMKQANKINDAKISKKYDKKFVDTIKGMDKMSKEDRVEEYKNYLQDPDNYTQDKFIENRLTKLGDGGNVNLNLRPEISTNELLKAKWGDVDPELEEDSYATVYSGTYCNSNEDTFGNFTPIIMNPETGEYIRCMDPTEFQEYCEDVMEGRREDEFNCQIGSWFTGEDAAKKADNAAIEIHELHEQQHVNKENKKKSK